MKKEWLKFKNELPTQEEWNTLNQADKVYSIYDACEESGTWAIADLLEKIANAPLSAFDLLSYEKFCAIIAKCEKYVNLWAFS